MSGMTKAQKQEKQEAIEKLREWIKPGDTVFTILRHVSRSGMQREIGVVLIGRDGESLHPNYLVAKALGERQGKQDGIIMGGCGMDMGFALVYNLSHALFSGGFGCIGEGKDGKGRCPSNDHSNGDRDHTPHNAALVAELEANNVKSEAGKHWHRDGGYALKHRWL